MDHRKLATALSELPKDQVAQFAALANALNS